MVAITYEAHTRLGPKVLASIEDEVRERFPILFCRVVHRMGRLSVGEASVACVVRSAHRDPAFSALRHAVEAVKTRAPIWKLEHYDDGEAVYLDGVSLIKEEPR